MNWAWLWTGWWEKAAPHVDSDTRQVPLLGNTATAPQAGTFGAVVCAPPPTPIPACSGAAVSAEHVAVTLSPQEQIRTAFQEACEEKDVGQARHLLDAGGSCAPNVCVCVFADKVHWAVMENGRPREQLRGLKEPLRKAFQEVQDTYVKTFGQSATPTYAGTCPVVALLHEHKLVKFMVYAFEGDPKYHAYACACTH